MLVVAGETIIDMIEFEPNRFEAFTGGGPYNVAKAAAKMGTDTGYISPISSDSFGDQYQSEMDKLGLKSLSPRSDKPSGLAIVKKDQNGHPSYIFYRNPAADRDVSLESIRAAMPTNAVAFYIGGLALTDGDDAHAWGEFSKGVNVPLFFDPNIRPSFIKDRASYLTRLDRVYSNTRILKLSDEDISWIAPGVAPRAYLGEVMAKFNIPLGLLTEGSSGASAITSSGEIKRSAQKITVIDTVGAGDCFSAASLSFLIKSGLINGSPNAEELGDMLEYAVTAAAINCTRAGANAPTDAEISAFVR